MLRRLLDWQRDYDRLLAMHRLSWRINFPLHGFSEVSFLDALQEGEGRHEVFIYEEDGELVGWLWLDLTEPEYRAHIRHLQVEQSHWGQGIGKAIVRDAIALARAHGCPVLTLNVTKENERAMRLYAGFGFQVEQETGARQRMALQLDGTA